MNDNREQQIIGEMLEKWDRYCDDPHSGFGTDEFTFFFAEQPSPASMARFLRRFEKADELQRRIRSYLDERTRPAPPATDDELMDAARLHVAELRRQVSMLGSPELVDELTQIQQYVIVDEIDLHGLSDEPEAEISEVIGDAVFGPLSKDRATNGLVEALYGITADYYLVIHLAEPIIATDVTMAPFHQLWQLGGVCAVATDRVLVQRIRTS